MNLKTLRHSQPSHSQSRHFVLTTFGYFIGFAFMSFGAVPVQSATGEGGFSARTGGGTDGTLSTAAVRTEQMEFPKSDARVWTLPNGLNLIVQEDRSAPVASVQAWCATGSINEGEWLGAGLSHILEHMLFKGTERRGANVIARTVEDLGGYINAYTSFDRTVYWIDIPKAGVTEALDLLCDAMMNSTLPEEEYLKEQEVIRREFAMGNDDPDRVASRLLFETAYTSHPFKYPVIGHLEIYNLLSRDDVMAYYRARYVPNNLTFVVVGDVDAQAVYEQVETFFRDYQRKPLTPVLVPEEPRQLGLRERHEEFPTDLSRLHLAWHIPGIEHPDLPALDLLGAILGSGRSSRLYTDLRDGRGLAYSVSAGAFTPPGQGLFIASAVTDPDKRESVREAILEHIRQAVAGGFTEEEMARARNGIFSDQIDGLTTMRGRASDLGSNWFLTRNLDFTRLYLDGVRRVTARDLQRVAAQYLTVDNLSVTSLNPVGTVPAVQKDHAPPMAGEIQEMTLSNGLRLLVREDRRLPLVALNAVFHAGVLAETPETNGISQLAASILLKGTETRTAEQIAAEIEGAGGAISTESGNNLLGISIEILEPGLELAAGILADVLVNPALPPKALETERSNQIAAIRAEDDDMLNLARQQMRARLFEGHPYALRTLGTPESVAGITRDQIRTFLSRTLTGHNGVLAVFGDVNAMEVRDLFERELAALPPGEPTTPAEHKLAGLQTSTVVETLPKNQAVLAIGYRAVPIDHPDRIPLDVLQELSSDMGSRFFNRIREQLGLAYFVGSVHIPGVAPGAFLFYLGTDPTKLETVQAAFEDEIAKLAHEGPTEEEMARAKSKLAGQSELARQSNAAFARSAAIDTLLGLGPNHYREYLSKVGNLSLDEIRSVARRYFADQPHIVSIVTRTTEPFTTDETTPAHSNAPSSKNP